MAPRNKIEMAGFLNTQQIFQQELVNSELYGLSQKYQQNTLSPINKRSFKNNLETHSELYLEILMRNHCRWA